MFARRKGVLAWERGGSLVCTGPEALRACPDEHAISSGRLSVTRGAGRLNMAIGSVEETVDDDLITDTRSRRSPEQLLHELHKRG